MVYMAGDNNLSSAGDADLVEMRRVGSTDRVSVVTEFDSAGSHGTRRFHVERDGHGEQSTSIGETDSGDPQVLIDFVDWATTTYPAKRYALVLWNHGGGWEPLEVDRIARSVNSPGYTERELSDRMGSRVGRAMFRTTLERIFALDSPRERAICSDDGSGHSLDTIELGRVLRTVTDRLGRRLDLLGCDACLMSNLEVAYESRPYARYMVASEENEPNQGWPYDRILDALTENPDMSAAELGRHIVTSYIAWYGDIEHPGPVTQCAVDLDRMDELTGPLDELAAAIAGGLPALAGDLWRAQRGAARFWNNTLWDLKHFAELLGGGDTNGGAPDASPDLTAPVAAVIEALAPGDDRFVLEEGHAGESVARCGGVTAYLPPPITPISRFYADLAFAREREWNSMLEAYHAS